MKINYFKTFLVSVAALLLSYCGPQEQSVDDSGQLTAEEIRLNEKVPVSVTVSEKGQEGLNLTDTHENFVVDAVDCASGYEESGLNQTEAASMDFYKGDRDCEIEMTYLYLEIDGSIVEFSGSWDDGAAEGETSSFDNSAGDIEVIVTVDSQLDSTLAASGDEAVFSYEVIRDDQDAAATLGGDIFDSTSVSVSGLNAPEYSLTISMDDGAGISASGAILIQLSLSCSDGGASGDSICGDVDSSGESDADNLEYFWGIEGEGEDITDFALATLDALSFSPFDEGQLTDPELISQEVEGSDTLGNDLAGDGQTYHLVLKVNDGTKASYQVFEVELNDDEASNAAD